MYVDEARELRAEIATALDPLYAARLGTIPALDGVNRAIRQLQALDTALLGVIRRQDAPVACTPDERACSGAGAGRVRAG